MIEKSSFNFVSYRVVTINVRIYDDYKFDPQIFPDIFSEYSIIEKESRKVDVFITMKLKTDNLLFEVVLRGSFQGSPDMDDKTFEDLYNLNAPAILFPYLRAIVSNYTLLANISPIVLPLIDLTENKAKERK